MLSFTRRLLTVTLAIPVFMSVQGCTDQDIAVGLGTVAIIGGAIAIGAAAGNDHHHYEPRPGYGHGYDHGYDHGYNDGYGHGGGYGGWGYRANSAPINLEKIAAQDDAPSKAEVNSKVAAHLGLTVDAATTLNTALQTAGQTKNLDAVYKLGLDKGDLKNLLQTKMISDQGVINLGRSLNVSTETARKAVETMLGDFRAQAADGSSLYWSSCTQSGSWKTPQNSRCESTSWQGCSVATGATLCLASK